MTTDEVQTAIIQLRETATDDEIAEAMDKLDYIKRFERDARDMLKAKMLERIDATGRDIEIGPKRYYSGTDRETKCVDLVGTLTALIVAMEGDIDRVARDAMRSDPFKPSVAKQVLTPEGYDRLFATTEKVVLKEGKPQKQLLCTDERFVKGTSNALNERKS